MKCCYLMELTTTLRSAMRRTKLVSELDPVSTSRCPKEQVTSTNLLELLIIGNRS